MTIYTFIAMIVMAAFFSCNSAANRKVLIMGRGIIATSGNDITVKDGSGYTQETVDVSGEKAVSWNVTIPAGKVTVNIPEEKGSYILNLKTDTIVGSRQIFGKDISSTHVMTQEELKIKIDSLIKLTAGANISSTGNNFIILPNELQKISDNTDAQIFGPFTQIPGTIETAKDGKAPEIYKFYTNTEMRELIFKLKKLSF